ncbi:UNVERIFIED_CONTAM: hypothetical protein HDU68_003652 [Siphonaria sp. JEL0065]|nr:hypothetical protein HDU68_003652 [Siphonaria sp. JEL0065]
MDVFSEAHTYPNEHPADSVSEIVPQHDEESHHSETEFKRVIAIAVDSSLYAQHAVNWAIKNYLQTTDLVVLLNARSFVTPPGTVYMDVANWIDQQETFQRSTSHKLLRSTAARLKHLGFATKAIALKGDIKDEIVRKAKEVHADALIVGSRGLGYFSRALVGSVSDYAVHYAHCPVLVIKPSEEELNVLKLAQAALKDSAINVQAAEESVSSAM